MAKIKVNFRVSDKRIVAAIAEGKSLTKWQCVEIELDSLTELQRKAISECVQVSVERNPFSINNELDLEGIDGVIKYCISVLKEKQDRFERDKQKLALEIDQFMDGKLSRIFGQGVYSDKSGNFDIDRLKIQIKIEKEKYNLDFDENAIVERAKVIQSEVDEERAEQNRLYEEKKKADAEAAEKLNAQKEAKKQELKAWALANGSELLKARIEENMNWVSLANDEWFLSVCPKGFTHHDDDDFDSCWDYNNPILEHINALREARKNDIFESVELRKCRKEENGYKYFYYFIVGYIRTFDGTSTVEVSKEIDSECIEDDEC